MPIANFRTGLKVCSKCRIELPIANFYSEKRRADKLCPHCKRCWGVYQSKYILDNPDKIRATKRGYNQRNKSWLSEYIAEWQRRNPSKVQARNRRFRHGLSPEDVLALKELQQGKCAGCLKEFSAIRECIDHCHSTGRIRGLLCQKCNTSLGMVDDKPETLRRLADYLESNLQLTV